MLNLRGKIKSPSLKLLKAFQYFLNKNIAIIYILSIFIFLLKRHIRNYRRILQFFLSNVMRNKYKPVQSIVKQWWGRAISLTE